MTQLNKELLPDFEKFMEQMQQDDSVREESFALGVAIYYGLENSDEIVKEYPDGRKEIVTLDKDYNELIVRVL